MHIDPVYTPGKFGKGKNIVFQVDVDSRTKRFETIHEALAYIQHEMNMMVAKRYER